MWYFLQESLLTSRVLQIIVYLQHIVHSITHNNLSTITTLDYKAYLPHYQIDSIIANLQHKLYSRQPFLYCGIMDLKRNCFSSSHFSIFQCIGIPMYYTEKINAAKLSSWSRDFLLNIDPDIYVRRGYYLGQGISLVRRGLRAIRLRLFSLFRVGLYSWFVSRQKWGRKCRGQGWIQLSLDIGNGRAEINCSFCPRSVLPLRPVCKYMCGYPLVRCPTSLLGTHSLCWKYRLSSTMHHVWFSAPLSSLLQFS